MKRTITYDSQFLSNLAKGSGYDSNSAISELIDNSIGAGAECIRITVKNGVFRIEDSGEKTGMNEHMLISNFFVGGCSSTKIDDNAPGKFGIGGKAGIVTIVGDKDTDVTIVTHKKNCRPITAKWEVRRGRNNEYEYNVLEDDNSDYGTSIEFEHGIKIDVNELINHISITYCWAIHSGTKIYVNNNFVTPSDPLYRENRNVIKNKMFTSKRFKVCGEEVFVNVSSFINGNVIPEEELHSWDKGGGKQKSVSTANRSGIYVRTGGRYYTLGNNFDKIMGGTAHASLDGLRIELCIPKSLWEEIGVTWNKGKEVTPFTKIGIFRTDNPETGVFDYISYVMYNFRNNKKTNDGNVRKVSDIICNICNSFELDSLVPIVNTEGCESYDFVNYDGNNIIFDPENTNMNTNEIRGFATALCVAVDVMKKNGNEDLIYSFIEKINK